VQPVPPGRGFYTCDENRGRQKNSGRHKGVEEKEDRRKERRTRGGKTKTGEVSRMSLATRGKILSVGIDKLITQGEPRKEPDFRSKRGPTSC